MRELAFQLRWALPLWLVGLFTNWWPDNRVSLRVRGALARPFIRQCGKGFELGAHVTLLNTNRLHVGNNVYIARGGWLNCVAGLYMEDEVVLGPYVVISTLQHAFRNGSVRFGGSVGRPVRIGRGSWLAAHSTVKCGVTIGASNLIGANSCVASDTPNMAVLGGVPARVIKENSDGEADAFTRRDIPEPSSNV